MKMMTLAVAMVLAIATTACSGGVVRDGHTYQQEMAFLTAVTGKLADTQLAQAAEAARGGDPHRCAELADDALLASVRVPYHVNKALFLADLRPEDPGPPPSVPEASSWCAAFGDAGTSVSLFSGIPPDKPSLPDASMSAVETASKAVPR